MKKSRGWVLLVLLVASAAGARELSFTDELTIVAAGPDEGGPRFLRPKGGAASSLRTPEEVLRRYGSAFGITDPGKELRRERSFTDKLGHKHYVYEQVFRGVPVFGGSVQVHHDGNGRFRAANGAFRQISATFETKPRVNARKAGALAVQAVGSSGAKASSPKLWIVDPTWYGQEAAGPVLVYHVVVTDRAAGLRESLFVDARGGTILDRWSLVESAQDRKIHDAAGTSVPLPGPLKRSEGQAPVGIADVDRAYDYAGDTYQLYKFGFGRDSFDNHGKRIRVTVRTGLPPVDGRWTGATGGPDEDQVVFSPGYDFIQDDFMGHELTHGVTQYSAALIYTFQAGQLNESFSDVFGELTDLYNGGAEQPGPPVGRPSWSQHPTGTGTDTGNQKRQPTDCTRRGDPNGVRWLIFEDTWSSGTRDMWNPPCYEFSLYPGLRYPDQVSDPSYRTCSCNPQDNYGVHCGSSVPNHAFAILTDGKTFNGRTVNAIGAVKAGAVWYRALTVYLRSTSLFPEAYAALNQAARDLIGTYPVNPRTGTASASMFTAQDAAEVDMALKAVEMDQPFRCGGPPPPPPPPPPIFTPTPSPTYAPPTYTPTYVYTWTPTYRATATNTAEPTSTPTVPGDPTSTPTWDFGDPTSTPTWDFGDPTSTPTWDFGDPTSTPTWDFGSTPTPTWDFGPSPTKNPTVIVGDPTATPTWDFGSTPTPTWDFGFTPTPTWDFGTPTITVTARPVETQIGVRDPVALAPQVPASDPTALFAAAGILMAVFTRRRR